MGGGRMVRSPPLELPPKIVADQSSSTIAAMNSPPHQPPSAGAEIPPWPSPSLLQPAGSRRPSHRLAQASVSSCHHLPPLPPPPALSPPPPSVSARAAASEPPPAHPSTATTNTSMAGSPWLDEAAAAAQL